MKKYNETKFYSLEEVAEIIQVSRRSMYNYIKDGRLKANKVGGRWIVSEEQLQNFIEGK